MVVIGLKQPIHMVAIYTIAYTLIFRFALVGNSLVITVVCRNPRMHNVTNYFIVNLAIADILVSLLCIPISLLMNLQWLSTRISTSCNVKRKIERPCHCDITHNYCDFIQRHTSTYTAER
jgi:hypothetical protein